MINNQIRRKKRGCISVWLLGCLLLTTIQPLSGLSEANAAFTLDADETIWLDPTSASATSNLTVAVGQRVFIGLKGTYSAWPSSWWSAGSCKGTPDAQPMFPGGAGSGPVGVDALFMFASPRGSVYCSQPGNAPSQSLSPFEVSLNGGSTWFRPTPSSNATYNTAHAYPFVDMNGQGHRPKFRINDPSPADNYGLLTVFVHVYTPTDPRPAAPSNLTVNNNGTRDQLVLDWHDNSNNETGFRIYEQGGTLAATVPANTTHYIFHGLPCGRAVEYDVTAFNSAGESEPSNQDFDAPPCGSPSTPSPTPIPSGGGDVDVIYEGFFPPAGWDTTCTGDRLQACVPIKLSISGLDEQWKPAARAAAEMWNNVGTNARFVETNVSPADRILVPVSNDKRLTDFKVAVGEVRIIVVKNMPIPELENKAAIGMPLRLSEKKPGIVAGLILIRESILPFFWGWTPYQRPLVLDAQTIIAHELGHVLFLQHTDAPSIPNVMHSYEDVGDKLRLVNEGVLRRTLGAEDLAALSRLYGPGSRTFAETGKTVSGRFWDAWQGGKPPDDSLYTTGIPISDVRNELSPTDGKSYPTQWFERARLELHPENQPPYDVLLGLLGSTEAKGRQNETPFKPVPKPAMSSASSKGYHLAMLGSNTYASMGLEGLAWFQETQHTLGDNSEGGQAIAAFWNNLGGIPQFGFPLSQPFMERNKDDGKTYLVQYFERQRFEYHPENKGTRYEVLLGRLGAEQMDGVGFGPVSGDLLHTGDRDQYLKKANVSIKDFTAEVKFYNPFDAKIGAWDVGISYRISGRGYFEVVVNGNGQWTALETLNGQFNILASGSLANWNSSASGFNTLKVVAINNEGQFFVNGQGIANLDLSRHNEQGDVAILTGRYPGRWRPGAVTRYENFTVRPLTAVPPASLIGSEEQEQRLIGLINQYRVSRGLTPFNIERALTLAARRDAEWLSVNNRACKDDTGAPDIVQFLNNLGYVINGGRIPSQCNRENNPQVMFDLWLAEAGIKETFDSTEWKDIGCGWWPQTPVAADARVWVSCVIAKR